MKVISANGERYFNGVAVEAQALGPFTSGGSGYTLLLRPWFWLLTRTRNCKIFSDMAAPDIISSVFHDRGFSDFSKKLQGSYNKLEYCVQYNESDYDFVCRLMERFGIHYYYDHSDSAHTLTMVDSASNHPKANLKVPWRSDSPAVGTSGEYFKEVRSQRRLQTGKVVLTDYDFVQPNADLKTTHSSSESYSHAQLEDYSYPAKYPREGATKKKKDTDGPTLTESRLQAHQAQDHRRYASGAATPLFPGAVFSLTQHAEADDYFVVEATNVIKEQRYSTGLDASSAECLTEVEFLPSQTVFRPPVVTPRPVIHGPQTARVIGQSGEEIDVDKYGRVLVHFFWDRDSKNSRRVRVAQLWAGAKWGGQFIPRIGQEVVVEFLDGDPDRPLIVGAVYNDKMQFPYDLPSNQTMSGIKSNSSKGGNGYNEFVFEDKKGSEFIRMHAQYDHNVTVLNTESWEIGENFKTDKGEASRTTKLKHGDDNLTVEKGDRNIEISEGDHTSHVTMGDHKIAIDLGSQSTQAMQQITLTVGQSKVLLDQTGVTIQGINISIEALASLSLSAPILSISADGVLSLQGAITKIN